MAKVQAHMMKNQPQRPGGPPMPMPMMQPGHAPNPQQQKIIQMQILQHLSQDISQYP